MGTYSLYDYYQSSNPYENINRTGAAQALAQENKNLQKLSESMQIDRIQRDVREMRHRVEMLDHRFNEPIRMFESHPEPSVEYSEPSHFWSNLFADPIFEIFKRPSMRTGSFYE